MNRRPTDSPHAKPLADSLSTCVWWLLFVGGVAAGAAAGLVLALWLCGNAAGWTLAAGAFAAPALAAPAHCGFPHVHNAGWILLPGAACP